LIVDGTGALYVDRQIQVNDQATARPIFVPYVSLATQALREWPHWMFVGAMTVFCPCIVAVSRWMAAVGRDVETDDESLPSQVEILGLITGLVGPILAASPMGNSIGTVVHIASAVVFLMNSTSWSNRVLHVKHLWIGEDDSTWPTTMARTVFILAYLGVGCIALSFYFAMIATAKLDEYESLQANWAIFLGNRCRLFQCSVESLLIAQ